MRGLALLLAVAVTATLLHGTAAQLLPDAVAEIVIVPESTTVREGNTVILTCVAYGVPHPDITWSREGEELSNTTRVTVYTSYLEEGGVPFTQATLEICGVELEDAGMYSCEGSNQNGVDTRSFNLTVAPIADVKIVVYPGGNSFTEQSTILLTCVGYGSPTNPNITWSREGELVEESDYVSIYQEVVEEGGVMFVMSTLEICSISSEQAGLYTCAATVMNRTAVSPNFWINVTSQASSEIVIRPGDSEVREENTVLLTCVAYGLPTPEISWTFGGETLANDTRVTIYNEIVEEGGVLFSSSVLEICSVELGDAGQYACVASNEGSTDSVSFELSVLPAAEPPTITISPNTVNEVQAGNTALFTCVAYGDPDPDITWLMNGNDITNGTRVRVYSDVIVEGGVRFVSSILEVCSTALNDSGNYSCVATNSGGQSTTSFRVDIVDESPPEIVIAPADSEVREGNTLLVTCVVYGATLPSVSWSKNGSMLSNSSGDRITIYEETVDEGGVLFAKSVLEICSAESGDAGQYSCVATNPYGEMSVTFDITVIQDGTPAQVTIAPQSSTITAGNTALFTCVGYGDPPPSITWIREDGSEVMNGSRVNIYTGPIEEGGVLFIHSVLEICSVEEADGGQYTCVVANSLGSSNSSFEVDVATEGPPEIVIAPADSEVREGNTLLVTCVAYGATLPSVSWNRNGSMLSNSSGDRITIYEETVDEGGVLFAKSVLEICSAESGDAGEYSCVATNPYGEASTSFDITVTQDGTPAQVTIAPQSSTITAGNTALFTCVGYGDPPPSITWIREDGSEVMNSSRVNIYTGPIEEGGVLFIHSVLEICSVEEADGGQYTCVVANSLGSSNSSFEVDVATEGPPEIVIAPADSEVREGNTLLVTCVAYGATLPSVSWNRNGSMLSNSSGDRITIYEETVDEGGVLFAKSVLEICSAESGDAGQYSCVATNPYGEMSVTFDITVIPDGTPAQVTIAPQSSTITAGNTALFTCVGYGDPPPSITWIREDGSEVMNGSRVNIYTGPIEEGGVLFIHSVLEICSVEEADGGQYTCVVANSLGSSNSSFEVDVAEEGPPEIVIAPADSEVREGNTLLVTCVAYGATLPSVSWSRNGSMLSNSSSDRITIYEETVDEGGVLFAKSVLEICSAESGDAGEYSCVATNPYGEASTSFDITVIPDGTPAQVTIAPQSSTITAGNTALFTCVGYGDPPPSITWIREDGSEVMNGSRVNIYTGPIEEGGVLFIHSVLEICSVEEADGGQYTCVVANSLGSSNSSFEVDVAEEGPPEIVIAPADSEVREGNTLLVTCVAYGATLPSVSWNRNGSMLSNSSGERITIYEETVDEGGVLFAKSVLEICSAESGDAGEYSCVATNPVTSQTDTSYFSITVVPAQDPAEIVIAPQDTTVTGGSTTLLTCVVYSLPATITWSVSRNGDPPAVLTNTSDVNIYEQEVNEGGVLFLHSILELCGVTTNDSGVYTCYAENSAGDDSASFELSVVAPEPPEIVIGPSDTTVTYGNTVLLTCVAYGVPFPSLSWYRMDTQLQNGTWDERVLIYTETVEEEGVLFAMSTLEICSAEYEDAGQFSCRASSTSGEDVASFTLSVETPNESPTVVLLPPDSTVILNNTILLTCVGYGIPPPALTWFMNGELLSNGSRVVYYNSIITESGVQFIQSVLEVCGATLSDQGDYQCALSNVAGNTSASFFLDVLEPPVIVLKPPDTSASYGSTILLTCVAVGDPDPSIDWLKGDSLIENTTDIVVYRDLVTEGGVTFSRSTLEVCSLDLSDEATYTCVANSSAGEDTASFSLDVVTEVTIALISNSTEIDAGNTVLLTCVATGNPTPQITWLKNNAPLETDDRVYTVNDTFEEENITFVRSVLEICDAEESDTAMYTCVASVPELMATANVNLTVNTAPASITVPPENQTIVTGSNVVLSCAAIGAPLPSIMWIEVTSGGVEVVNSSTFTISTAVTVEGGATTVRSTLSISSVAADAGYACVARNDIGPDTEIAYITVQVPVQITTNPSSTAVTAGETATFTCEVSGTPTPSITWFRVGDDQPLAASTRVEITSSPGSSELRIIDTQLYDDGTQYYCMGYQTLVDGERNATSTIAELTVNSPPVLSHNYTGNSFIGVLHGTLILTFTISNAQPNVTSDNVVWTFDSNDAEPVVITEGTNNRSNFTYSASEVRLRIHPVMLEDEGRYTVNVSNLVGSDSAYVDVNVVVGAVITTPPMDTTVHVGQTATFTCIATAEPAHTVVWQFDGQILTDGDKYNITDVSSTTSVLEIRNVDASDAGRYMCLVENAHGEDMDEAVLTVISVPVVTTDTPDLIGVQGEEVALQFTISADIPPVGTNGIVWSFTNTSGATSTLTIDDRFSSDLLTLTISPVEYSDEGTYTLTATNVAGSGSAMITLDVRAVPIITTPPTNTTAILGTNATFTCEAMGEPQPTLSWSYQGATLSSNTNYSVSEDGQMLTVISVSVEDGGDYTCVATNDHGQATATANLMPISVPVVSANTPSPAIAVNGTSFTISFSIEDDIPSVTPDGITWMFTDSNGDHNIDEDEPRFTFTSDMRNLTIDPVHSVDEGTYTLTATNAAGTDSANVQVDVQFVPYITTPPTDTIAILGTSATFTCEAMGEPQPTLSWSYQGATLSSNTNYSVSEDGQMLTVISVSVEDGGDYTCVATNDHGQATATANLMPISVPVVTTDTPDLIGVQGGEVTLQFTISADIPTVDTNDIVWSFTDTSGATSTLTVDDRFTSDRLTLTISPVEYTDEGTYTLTATNVAGSGSAMITLDVQSSPVVVSPPSPTRQHEDANATFTCTIFAKPLANISWQFNGAVIDTEEASGDMDIGGERYMFSNSAGDEPFQMVYQLTIVGLLTTDAGLYSCSAENPHGSVVSVGAMLEVLVEPEITRIAENLGVITGQSLSVSFSSSGREYPTLQPSGITWRFQSNGAQSQPTQLQANDRFSFSADRLTFTLSDATIDDEGQYWIVADNDAGQVTSMPTTVDVFVNPSLLDVGVTEDITLDEGMSVSFNCTANGEPQPTISWSKNEELFLTSLSARFIENITDSDAQFGDCSLPDCRAVFGQLTILNLTTSDSGNYSCKASNGLTLDGALDAVPTTTPYSLTVNRIVIDYCASNPCLNGGTCGSTASGFVCECQENFNGITCENVVEARFPPVFVVPPITLFARLFGIAVFFCEAEGNPQPEIEWFKDGDPLSDQRGHELIIAQVELRDRGEYYCQATNILGTIQSSPVYLNLNAIAQFRLLIAIFGLLTKRAEDAMQTNVDMLVTMLNNQLAGTMIGNATVYSVEIQPGAQIDPVTGEVPLIFTFFSEEEEEEQQMAEPGEMIIVDLDVQEIEKVVEEDVMITARELGINVTVERFSRFDGCSAESTTLPSSISTEYDVVLDWGEIPIGGQINLTCPCDAVNLKRNASRTCGGDFMDGGEWMTAMSAQCDFSSITRQLCGVPGLSEIERLVQDVANLGSLEVAVATELLEDMIDSSGGNTTASAIIFNSVEDILKADSARLSEGQAEFNTSSRILWSLERLSDAYPTSGSGPTILTRDSFGFAIQDISSTSFSGITFSASLGDTFSFDSIGRDNLALTEEEDATVTVTLPDGLSVGSATGVVFSVYTSEDLFVSRPEFLIAQNRTDFAIGSVVVGAHFRAQLTGRSLDMPVRITFLKSPEAVANGSNTECSFWDQSLDSYYGGWSTEGCRLVRESRREATCECDHLTQFALLVDVSGAEEEEEEDKDDSIGAGSYVGGLVCIVFLAIILVTYLASRDLRSSPLGISVINTSCCLAALFISYLISYYTTDSDAACTIFSAVFHYLFLVTTLSLLLMTALHAKQPPKLAIVVAVAIALQLILPAIVVIISAAPDQDNYINEEFCRPQSYPYWFGLLLISGIVYLASWIALLLGPCMTHEDKDGSNSWLKGWVGVALTLLLFGATWAFGLPSTNSLDLGATRLVFQILFVIMSALLGLVMFIVFCLLPRDARDRWTSWFNNCIPGRTGRFITDRSGQVEENLYTSGIGMGEMGMMEAKVTFDDDGSQEGASMPIMIEKEDGEQYTNFDATEGEEEGEDRDDSEPAKIDITKEEGDDEASKDTKL